MFLCFFFFFQAEDGIRDHCVTGVQTCALPIFLAGGLLLVVVAPSPLPYDDKQESSGEDRQGHRLCAGARSEERRVGKECISRWSPDHEKKKRADCESSSMTE